MRITLLFLLFYLAGSAQTVEVFFDFNADMPSESSIKDLQGWISDNPNSEIIALIGYADSVDASGYNRDLSERRINSVLDILLKSKVKIDPALEKNPIGENFSQSPKQEQNRKVLVKYRPVLTKETGLAKEVKDQFSKAKKGDLIRIHNIHFELNSEKVLAESRFVLEDLYMTMMEHTDFKFEIHGHICCNPDINDTKLSYRRAKFIFSYLLAKGVPLSRLSYRGFGSARPIYPIPEENYDQEQMNRRVEILVKDKIPRK